MESVHAEVDNDDVAFPRQDGPYETILQRLEEQQALLERITRQLHDIVEHETHFQTLVVREVGQPDQEGEGETEWLRDLFHFWCCYCGQR